MGEQEIWYVDGQSMWTNEDIRYVVCLHYGVLTMFVSSSFKRASYTALARETSPSASNFNPSRIRTRGEPGNFPYSVSICSYKWFIRPWHIFWNSRGCLLRLTMSDPDQEQRWRVVPWWPILKDAISPEQQHKHDLVFTLISSITA